MHTALIIFTKHQKGVLQVAVVGHVQAQKRWSKTIRNEIYAHTVAITVKSLQASASLWEARTYTRLYPFSELNQASALSRPGNEFRWVD